MSNKMVMSSVGIRDRGNRKRTIVRVGNVAIGEGVSVIAGPCAVENEVQMVETALSVKKAGADMLRGGAFKPRTSPYAFQGLGIEGLKILKKAREESGLPVVTEVIDTRDVGLVGEYADVMQIGSRNIQNFPLLKEVGRAGKPVLLKRGMQITIEEWLNCAAYVLNEGNPNVILCERGIRTFEPYTRNTLDLSAVPAIKELSHLPIIIDPSHGTGRRSFVLPMSLAAIAAGADGIMVEVHIDPDRAVCDREQTVSPEQFEVMMKEVRLLHESLIRIKLIHDEIDSQPQDPGQMLCV